MPSPAESPAPDIQGRVGRLRDLLARRRFAGILVTNPENRRYLSGFAAADPMMAESSGALLITSRRLWLLTDSRYVEAAAAEAPLYEVVQVGHDRGREVKRLVGRLASLAFEAECLSVAERDRLAQALGRTSLVQAPPEDLGGLRAVKEPSEVALIAKALRVTERAVDELLGELGPGWTEERAAWRLDSRFRELGGQGPAFETIVAAGPRASLPHAVPGPARIKSDQMVVVDCGARYRGYASDMTRTWVGPKAKPWQREIYEIVRLAQKKALEVLAPGTPGREVDQAARDVIAQAGYGQYFGHALGHGVGLAVHEEPRLSPRALKPLPVGAVVTVEPGIYLPGRGGVRLEQLVHLTAAGPVVLNRRRDLSL
jgi:Xaa-Pro aminopeptidase